jgi:Pectate lyase superfamily protein
MLRSRRFLFVIVLTGLLGIPVFAQTDTATAANTSEQTLASNSSQPAPNLHIFNVCDFGAVGDGKTKDTAAISKAIHAANQSEGGEVVFPPGTYVTGTFEMLSNVTLDLQVGAVLLGSPDVADYGDISDFGFDHNYGVSSSGEGNKVGMIVGRGVENVAIIGQGVIDGNSSAFFDFNTPHVGRDFDASFTRNPKAFAAANENTSNGPVEVKAAGRPGTMIICSHCKHVVIRDITFKDSPNWTFHLRSTEDAIVSGLRVDADLRIPNNDGMDCMRCCNVHVSDCNMSAGDDDFAFVSSGDVSVANCTLISNSSGIRLEDTRDSTFSNLVIHANRGLGIYDRGDGNTANVLFSNLVIESHLVTGHWWGKGEPILIASAGKAEGGGVHDVRFTNIAAQGQSGIVLWGTHADAIRSIRFDGMKLVIQAPSPELADAIGGNFDVRWVAKNFSEAVYKHDIAAVFGHNISDLQMNNVEVGWGENLPSYFTLAIELEDFHGLSISGFSGRQAFADSSAAVIELRRGAGVSILGSKVTAGAGTFVSSPGVSGWGCLWGMIFLRHGGCSRLVGVVFLCRGIGGRLCEPRRQNSARIIDIRNAREYG